MNALAPYVLGGMLVAVILLEASRLIVEARAYKRSKPVETDEDPLS
jgi:hypothetical protein